MADLPSSHPNLSMHLTDAALTPLLSSSATESENSQQNALASLTTASLTAYTSASRFGIGLPQRIMIETRNGGPVLLHSYLNPEAQIPTARKGASTESEIVSHIRDTLQLLGSANTDDGDAGGESGAEEADEVDGRPQTNGSSHGSSNGKGKMRESAGDITVVGENEAEEPAQLAPMLIATIVAPRSSQASQARRAGAKLERVGGEFQRRWAQVRELELEAEKVSGEGFEDTDE